jgi:hypothetical protein
MRSPLPCLRVGLHTSHTFDWCRDIPMAYAIPAECIRRPTGCTPEGADDRRRPTAHHAANKAVVNCQSWSIRKDRAIGVALAPRGVLSSTEKPLGPFSYELASLRKIPVAHPIRLSGAFALGYEMACCRSLSHRSGMPQQVPENVRMRRFGQFTASPGTSLSGSTGRTPRE